MPADPSYVIVDYDDRFAAEFARLNRAWLDAHGLYEEADGHQLYSPRESILSSGGEIYIALKGDVVAGTCALVPHGRGSMELAKLTVAEHAQGNGLGRRLTEHALDRARALGVETVSLLSSSKLTAALHLYETMGFVHKPLPAGQPYETADVYMELDIRE